MKSEYAARKEVDSVAIYHCSIKIISRGKGKSAVAAKAKNSQLAREIEIALPVELDRKQQIQLVREYVKENFVSVGMCADFAINDKQDGNPHAHIMHRYGKIRDLKAYAKAVSFIQSKNITTLVQLQEVVSDMKKRYWNTNGEIKQTEKLLHERKELIDQAEKYIKHRPTYKAYMQTKPKKQEEFYERNRAALTLYQSAERYLKENLGSNTTLKLKAWKDEVAALTSEKDSLYDEIHRLKTEVQEAEAVKKCVEQAVQPEQTRAKTQSKRRDMEL